MKQNIIQYIQKISPNHVDKLHDNYRKSTAKKPNLNRVIVVGTSAVWLQALTKFANQLQSNFPVPILVVQHISSDATGNALLDSQIVVHIKGLFV